MDKWILDEHSVPRRVRDTPAGHMQWAQFFENVEGRILRRTEVEDELVSTVFLGFNHQFEEDGPPLLFETAVRLESGDYDILCRSSTLDEAMEAHRLAVQELKRQVNQ